MNDVGRIGEALAARFLKKNKYKIIERNIHASHNELDIVAIDKKNKVIIFAEVKARSSDKELSLGTAALAVTKAKRERTVSAAKAYLSANKKYYAFQPRFDVLEVYLSKSDLKLVKINHIENAFGV